MFILLIFFFQEQNHDTAQLGSDAEIKWISHLLELSDEWLKQALTNKVTVSLLLVCFIRFDLFFLVFLLSFFWFFVVTFL